MVIVGDAGENGSGTGLAIQRDLLRLSTSAVERHVPGADHGSIVHDPVFAAITAECVIEMIER